jgi:hypothetical protein
VLPAGWPTSSGKPEIFMDKSYDRLKSPSDMINEYLKLYRQYCIDPLILDQNRLKVSGNIGFVFSFKPEALQG